MYTHTLTMRKIELTKSIEAAPLNERTGIPTSEPAVTIPYGAIVENVEHDRDFDKFTYLGQPYRCPHEMLGAAAHKQPVAPAPAAVHAPHAAAKPTLVWHELASAPCAARRAKVPGGWLVSAGGGVAFYPDPQHSWDGASLP
jgi:hypothetical protein